MRILEKHECDIDDNILHSAKATEKFYGSKLNCLEVTTPRRLGLILHTPMCKITGQICQNNLLHRIITGESDKCYK